MKKISASLLALSLFSAVSAFAAGETPAPVPAAIAQHIVRVRTAAIRILCSGDNTTQLQAGSTKPGRWLCSIVATFPSIAADAAFHDF